MYITISIDPVTLLANGTLEKFGEKLLQWTWRR